LVYASFAVRLKKLMLFSFSRIPDMRLSFLDLRIKNLLV